MVSLIDKNTTVEQLQRVITKSQAKRGINAMKYCGVIHLKESPLAIQKRMRREWK